MYKKGIDVSQWQGAIDWQKVKNSGVAFAMIRAGYGQNNVDKQFVRNISECNRLGIPCGIYWFSYATTAAMAKKEAQYALAAVKPYHLDYPVAFDFEYDSVNYASKAGVAVTKQLATSIATAFLDEVESAGYYGVLYTNQDYLNRYFDVSLKDKYDIWLASWYTSPNFDKPPMDCGLWQYASDGVCAGISGNVDLDIAYKDYPALMEQTGLNRHNEPEKTPYEEELEKATSWAKEAGIFDGSRLDDPAKRSEVVLMLYRALNPEK